MANLNKDNIIDAVAQKTGQSKKATEEMVDTLLDFITESIRKGEKVTFTGFGSFSVNERKGRKGINPRTGESIDIPAVKVPKFKAGMSLKQAVK